MCQQSHGEDPACGLPQPPMAQPPLQLAVCPAQAEACQHTHCSIALQPETLNLQTHTHTQVFPVVVSLFQNACTAYIDVRLSETWTAVVTQFIEYKHTY